jgi:hypothetical protein
VVNTRIPFRDNGQGDEPHHNPPAKPE